jgi:hypothetical protein
LDMGHSIRSGGDRGIAPKAGSRVSDDAQPSARDAFLHGARAGKISVSKRPTRATGDNRWLAGFLMANLSELRPAPNGSCCLRGRRPDGPIQVRRSMTKARHVSIGIFRYRGITSPFTRPTEASACHHPRWDSGRRLGRGAWVQAPAKAGGWTRWSE